MDLHDWNHDTLYLYDLAYDPVHLLQKKMKKFRFAVIQEEGLLYAEEDLDEVVTGK